MKKLLDIRFYHFILRVLPRVIPKYIWDLVSPILFTVYLRYAKKLHPLFFGTPSERAVEYSWAIKNLQESDKRILDVGCGDNIFDCKLAGHSHEVYVIDLESQYINKKSKYHFLQGDIVHAPFKDQGFDKIHALSTVEHIDNQIGCMMELSRILKEGGGLILTMPLGDYDEDTCDLYSDMYRFKSLIRTAIDNGLRCDAQDYYIAQGRKWEIISGDRAIEKIKPLLNKKKIIVCLSFTKKLDPFKEGANPWE